MVWSAISTAAIPTPAIPTSAPSPPASHQRRRPASTVGSATSALPPWTRPFSAWFPSRTMAAMDDQRSAGAVVEAGWQAVRDDGRVRPELLAAAYAEPRLRQLFPWTGM